MPSTTRTASAICRPPYGFYQDRKMWDDVVDLFAANSLLQDGAGLWHGPKSIRRWLEIMGPAGLKHGELNDQVSSI